MARLSVSSVVLFSCFVFFRVVSVFRGYFFALTELTRFYGKEVTTKHTNHTKVHETRTRSTLPLTTHHSPFTTSLSCIPSCKNRIH